MDLGQSSINLNSYELIKSKNNLKLKIILNFFKNSKIILKF